MTRKQHPPTVAGLMAEAEKHPPQWTGVQFDLDPEIAAGELLVAHSGSLAEAAQTAANAVRDAVREQQWLTAEFWTRVRAVLAVTVTQDLPSSPLDGLMGIEDIADMFAVSRSTVDQWRQRTRKGEMHPPLPEPVGMISTTPVWIVEDLIEWGINSMREIHPEEGA